MQSVEILQARERCSVDVLVPDLAHGNALVKGAGRAVLEGDLDLLLVLILRIFDPVHPVDGGGEGAVLPDDSVAFAQELGHDVLDLVGVHGGPSLRRCVGALRVRAGENQLSRDASVSWSRHSAPAPSVLVRDEDWAGETVAGARLRAAYP